MEGLFLLEDILEDLRMRLAHMRGLEVLAQDILNEYGKSATRDHMVTKLNPYMVVAGLALEGQYYDDCLYYLEYLIQTANVVVNTPARL